MAGLEKSLPAAAGGAAVATAGPTPPSAVPSPRIRPATTDFHRRAMSGYSVPGAAVLPSIRVGRRSGQTDLRRSRQPRVGRIGTHAVLGGGLGLR